MSKSEIIQLLEKSDVKPLLPMEKIAEYSLGIPGLAIKIASHADTDAAALMIVVNNFKGQLKQKDSVNKLKGLTTGESQLSLDTLSQINQDYNILSYLNRIQENSERFGLTNTEASPYFVAPESVALYGSRAEIKEIAYDIGSVIMAYNIPTNILPEFENSFLPDSYTQTTRRLRMFGAECHKIDIFELDQDGKINPLINSERAKQNDIAADFLSNNSPQLPKDLGNQTKVFFSAGDHGARHNSLELRLWAIESFLQQYGIQYVVKNVGWRNKNYKFNPQTGHLEFFDKDEK